MSIKLSVKYKIMLNVLRPRHSRSCVIHAGFYTINNYNFLLVSLK